MIKTLFHQIGAYKKDSILTPIYAAAEVIMEILIPFVTAAIIDEGIQAGNMQKVLQYGVIMIVLALLSLFSVFRRAGRQPVHLPDLPAICGRVCIGTYRPFPFPILINSARQVLLRE